MNTIQDGKPKTADGVEFRPGMTLISRNGVEIITDPDVHEVRYETFTIEGSTNPWSGYILARKGSASGSDLAVYYSSHDARVEAEIKKLEDIKTTIDMRIASMREAIRDGYANLVGEG